jgi:hypothetical protein
LDQYPNFAVDAAARVSFLARQDRQTARQFLVKYQDRILYGSDSIVLPDPAEDDETWRSVNAAHEREWRFFATADVIRFGGGTSANPAARLKDWSCRRVRCAKSFVRIMNVGIQESWVLKGHAR